MSDDDVSVIPAVTVAQMREVDRIMVDELRIELLQMMENAGRCLAAHTRNWLGGQVTGRQIVVLGRERRKWRRGPGRATPADNLGRRSCRPMRSRMRTRSSTP